VERSEIVREIARPALRRTTVLRRIRCSRSPARGPERRDITTFEIESQRVQIGTYVLVLIDRAEHLPVLRAVPD
jgi:hypothetical protein